MTSSPSQHAITAPRLSTGPDDWTICTVSYGHAEHLALNWRLGQYLNQDRWGSVRWIVAENAPASVKGRFTGTESQFEHFPGSANTSEGASQQHALALNALLKRVRTRFALVLDPDFYILRRGWLTDVESFMKLRRLAFFGAPWHPRYLDNYRYFPAVHCMFIDRSLVSLDEVDFRPKLAPLVTSATDGKATPRLHRLMALLRFEHRRRISWDTGTRVFERFGDDSRTPSECLVPVYRLPRDWLGKGDPTRLRSRLLETLLPDNRCYLPKVRASYTSKDFTSYGWKLPDLPRLWEQHIWRDAPFGLHMRRSFGGNDRDGSTELKICRNLLESVFPEMSIKSTAVTG